MRRSTWVALAILSCSPGWAEQGVIVGEQHTIDSQVLGEQRTVLVRTPAGYATRSDQFMVLYLTDAESQFLHTCATVDFLSRTGRIPPLIVVGVTNTQRTRDLTPTASALTVDGRVIPGLDSAGGAERFLDFFQRELIPWVEARYRTLPYRVFAGHSFGGLFGLHAFFTRPALFQSLIAVSPTLIWDDDLPLREAKRLLQAAPPTVGGAPRRLFVTLGSEGPQMQAAFGRLKALLRRHRSPALRWSLEQYLDEDHGSVVLRSHYAGLRELFRDWALPVDPESRMFVGGLQDVTQHYHRFSRDLGIDLPIPEDSLNRLGYALLQAGQVNDAVLVFRQAIAAHPRSANAHDSLGEALEQAGRREAALTAYRQAVELAEQQGDPNLEFFRGRVRRLTDESTSR